MLHRPLLAAIAAACLVAVLGSAAPAVASTALLASVRADIGTNPTGWKKLWCAVYLKEELKDLGYHSAAKKVDARARSFLKLKHTRLRVGAIAVLKRKGGEHVGVVEKVLEGGRKIVVISGNSGPKPRKVRRQVYDARRVIAYVTP